MSPSFRPQETAPRTRIPRTTDLVAQWRSPRPEMIRAAADGATDKEIARLLGIAVTTVDYHWRSIRRELGVTTRTQAVVVGLALLSPVGQADDPDEVATLREDLRIARHRAEELEHVLQELRQLHVLDTRRWQTLLRDRNTAERTEGEARFSAHSVGVIHYRMQNAPPFACRFVSESIQRYGYEPEELTSGRTSIYDLIDDEDLAELLTQGQALAAKKDRRASFLYRLKCADGRRVWMLDQNAEVDTPEGPRAEYVGVAVEVDTLVRAGLITPFHPVAWWPDRLVTDDKNT